MEATRRGAGVRRVPPLALIAFVLAGCGASSSSHRVANVAVKTSTTASGGKTFSAKGMLVHFVFPDGFRVIPLEQSRRTVGTTSGVSKAAVGPGSYDLLVVVHYPDALPASLTVATLPPAKRYFDGLMTKLAGRRMRGKVGTIAGEFAFLYPRIPITGLPVPASVQISDLFVGKDEYELQCQATPGGLATLAAACREMLATMTVSK
jgi:hypothetical protein